MKRILSILLAVALCVSMVPAALAANNGTLLALGDSIPSGYGVEAEESYPALVAEGLGLELNNKAAEGMTTAVLAADLSTGTYNEDIAAASVITLTIGGNDLMSAVYSYITTAYNTANGTEYTLEEIQALLADLSSNYSMALSLLNLATDETVLAGMLTSATAALTDFQANLVAVVEYLSTANPEATIIVTTQYNPYLWLGDAYSTLTSTFSAGVEAMNTVISTVGAGYGCVVVDVASAFAASEENLSNADVASMSLDFHPNAAGHAVYAETILAAVGVEEEVTDEVVEEEEVTEEPAEEEVTEEETVEETPTVTIPFTDIADSPYATSIAAVYAAGLMNGTSATTFDPEGELTRAMLYTIVYRLMGEPEVTGTSSFIDVADGMWYTDAIVWAAATGLDTGVTDELFMPNVSVTREQLAVLLYRYAASLGIDTSVSASLDVFSDGASVQAYATEAVQWAVACGILTSRADGTLAPGEAATRGEVAQAISLLLG